MATIRAMPNIMADSSGNWGSVTTDIRTWRLWICPSAGRGAKVAARGY